MRVGIFVFKTPKNLEQLQFVFKIYNENNRDDKEELRIILSQN